MEQTSIVKILMTVDWLFDKIKVMTTMERIKKTEKAQKNNGPKKWLIKMVQWGPKTIKGSHDLLFK